MKSQPLSLSELQKSMLDILRMLIRISEKENINYYVYFGTLLGAVRHNGFIPWDDDVDVVMLRNDYDRFVDFCIKHRDEILPYRLVCSKTECKYPYSIARLVDTRYHLDFYDYEEYESGTFVDIYPYDGAGNNPKSVRYRLVNLKKILFECLLIQSSFKKPKKEERKIIKNALNFLAYKYAKRKGRKHWVTRLESLKSSYILENSKYVNCMVWDTTSPLRKDIFGKPVKLKFENMSVNAPKEYKYVLKKYYGNYNLLPPEEKRQPTHRYVAYRKSE